MGSRHAVAPSQERAQTPHGEVADQASEPLTGGGERFPRRARLSRGTDLIACWEEGHRLRLPHLEIAWRTNQAGHPRTGTIVPRYQHTAVARNRLRRRLREILRRDVLPDLTAIDLVVRPRRGAYSAVFAVLRAEMTEATRRIP